MVLSKYGESNSNNGSSSQSNFQDKADSDAEKGRRKHMIMETCGTFERVIALTVENELQQYLLPKSICRLVGNLLEAGRCNGKMSFDKLRDVSMDPSQIFEDPQQFLFNNNIAKD
mmetsp:Transcript_12022/g.25384  ORF Transcript_12022/g.25384 Transcript_12022/m.25384 type:complete len:115 (+) Transcript_12022:203-547(+)